jgi:hypothetical protein
MAAASSESGRGVVGVPQGRGRRRGVVRLRGAAAGAPGRRAGRRHWWAMSGSVAAATTRLEAAVSVEAARATIFFLKCQGE